jgi:phosphodiesterase/alkaline phosphatase D-like protein
MKNYLLIGAVVLVVVLAGAYSLVRSPIYPTITSGATSTNPTVDVVASNNVDPVTGTSVTPGKPVATTNSTVAPTDTTAVVTGTVMPGGAITAYWYEYGTTKDLGNKTAVQVVGSGYTAISTPGYITGLTKNTTYYFRLVAQNSFGSVFGDTNSVTTTSFSVAPVGGLPSATTEAASGITSASATLKGSVNPNKVPTQYWFEIGKNGSLGSITAFTSVGSGSAAVAASASFTALDAGTTYYYRLNAQNQYGTVNGAILTFKTAGKLVVPLPASPVVTTQLSTSIATTSAVLAGTVNPYGADTSYWFEYSTTANFSQSKTTTKKSAGAGSATVSVQANLSGLKAQTTYYVRIVAENGGGTVKGDSQTFQTK